MSDPTRRAILARLAEGEATVTELAEPFQLTQPAISQHLKVLEDAGLIIAALTARAVRASWRKPASRRWISGLGCCDKP